MSKSPIHFNEYNTWDVEAAKAFYGAVAGWEFHELPVATADAKPYTLCMSGGEIVAGIFPYVSPMFDGGRDFWLTYIAVADAVEAAKAVETAGGHVRRQPFVVPGFGTLIVCDDNAGATLGFIQPPPQEQKT